MRIFYVTLLMILGLAVTILALENRDMIVLRYFGQNIACAQAILIGVIYLVGIVTGWFTIGLLRRVMRETV